MWSARSSCHCQNIHGIFVVRTILLFVLLVPSMALEASIDQFYADVDSGDEDVDVGDIEVEEFFAEEEFDYYDGEQHNTDAALQDDQDDKDDRANEAADELDEEDGGQEVK